MGLVLPVRLDDIQMERGIYHGCGNRPTPWISEEAMVLKIHIQRITVLRNVCVR